MRRKRFPIIRLPSQYERLAWERLVATDLSPRQRQVAYEYMHGLGESEIADVLDVSVASVHAHLGTIRQRLNLPYGADSTACLRAVLGDLRIRDDLRQSA